MLNKIKNKIRMLKLKRKLLKMSKKEDLDAFLGMSFLFCLGLILIEERMKEKEKRSKEINEKENK